MGHGQTHNPLGSRHDRSLLRNEILVNTLGEP
jgi:hypothetical protein